MKRFSLFFGSVFVFSLFFAACVQDGTDTPAEPPRDPHKVPVAQALADLDGLLCEIDGTTRGGGRSVRSVETLAASELTAATRSEAADEIGDLIHIVNFDNDGGYAILGADDRIPSVIAVTEQGNLSAAEFVAASLADDPDTENPALRPELVEYVQSLSEDFPDDSVSPTDAPSPYLVSQVWRTIEKTPILTYVKWNQDGPYNYYVKKYISNGEYTGCVAVAVAQIITSVLYKYYWQRNYIFPEDLKTINGEKIDWEAIFRDMDAGKYTYESEDDSVGSRAVAWLMFVLGGELDLNYNGYDGTSGKNGAVSYFFRNFRFKMALDVNYSTNQVDMMLTSFNLPVYTSGADMTVRKGHAWVIDGRIEQKRALADPSGTGYTEEWRTLYHCNYGYDGDYDGYYYSKVFDLKNGAICVDKQNHDKEGTRERNYSNDNVIITCAGFTI